MFLSFERGPEQTEMPLIVFVVTLDVYRGLYVSSECHKVLSLFSLQHWQIRDCVTNRISCTFSCISQYKVPQFWLLFLLLNIGYCSVFYLGLFGTALHLALPRDYLMKGKLSLAVCPSGFRRKEFRGKLAIAITANFINRNTTAEAKVEEISGVAFIFNQRFFQELRRATGIERYII